MFLQLNNPKTMNHLRHLIETKLKIQSNVIFGSEWTGFPYEIQKSLETIRPDAVYHFNKQPFILFFDFTETENRNREKSLIHRQVWCFDKTPVVFFVFEDEVQIYNAFHYQREYDTLKRLDGIEDEYEEQFSFWKLQSGSTWQWLQETFYNKNINKKRVNQKLFDNIKETRKKLTKNIKPALEDTFANILILRLIFVRYLIDRNVEFDEKFIAGDTVKKRKQSFNKLIGNQNRLNAFFRYLEDRFNGNLFETKNDPNITQKHLDELARIFSSYKDQFFLFDVFDFSIIPVETISGIYESIIDPKQQKKNSAVYTPSFLVDYILSQTVDKVKGKNAPLILDPACGSGIFLVQAYRRMVETERKKAEEGKLSDQRLKELVQQNLFGIDKDQNALNVTAFSLYVALLDYKQPPEIKKFKLPRLLDSNLFQADFLDEEASFNFEDVFLNKQFDFILGNPPWGSKKYKKHLDYIKKHKLSITRNEIAQTFLARSKDFVNRNTQCALVVTSKAFHNLTARNFKKYFLTKFQIRCIFDLSPVRRLIFPQKNNPAMVIFYRYAFGQSTEDNVIDHLSAKQNIFLKYFNTLVIERQDRKKILQKYFVEYHWMFKVALYGNTLDFHLLKKWEKHKPSIQEWADQDKSIICGDGILLGNPKKYFPSLQGIPIIEHNQINRYYSFVALNKKLTREDTFLESGRTLELFDGHHILLKSQAENESSLVVSYIDTPSVFKRDVFGITSKTAIDKLKVLYGIMISSLYTYYLYMVSSAWGVSTRPAIRFREEYLSFPYMEFKNKEALIDAVNHFIAYYKGTQDISADKLLERINKMVNDNYGINELEKDLIDYTLDVSRYQFQENKLQKVIRPPSKDELRRYAEIFYNHFSQVYNEGNEYFQIEIYPLPYFVAMLFRVVETLPASDKKIEFKRDYTERRFFEIIAQTFSIDKESDKIFIQKDVKGFEDNFFYTIKPNEYKCWHRAIAHYDLAEFVNDLEKAELEELTEAVNE